MECRIYDTSLNAVAVIQSWISLEWQEEYNGAGSFTLEVYAQTNILDDIQLDYYCGINDSETLMIIKSIIAQDNRVIINGCAAIYLLNDRISTTEIDGTATDALTLMRGLITNMTSYPRVENEPNPGSITATYNGTLDKGSVYDRISAIAADTDIGITLKHDRDNRKLLFHAYRPEDVTEMYFPEYGNISNAEYMLGNIDHKNVAVVEGATQTVTVGETSTSGVMRKELYVDATGEEQGEQTATEYKKLLGGLGLSALEEHNHVESINFDLMDDTVTLGTLAGCKLFNSGVFVRIIGIDILSQNNRIERRVTLGTPIIRK